MRLCHTRIQWAIQALLAPNITRAIYCSTLGFVTIIYAIFFASTLHLLYIHLLFFSHYSIVHWYRLMHRSRNI
jgi:hypothetical protein